MEILSLGEKIKRRRKELNMTLKDLAGDRITPGQISLVESGKSNPSMDLLEYLSDALNTSIEYLMESEETQAEKICNLFENIATAYILNGDFSSAEKYVENVLNYAEKYNLEYRKAKNLYLRGIIYMKRGEDLHAQQIFLSANIIFIKLNSSEDIVNTLLKLGIITLNMKAYNSAYSYFKQAEKVFMDNDIGNDYLLGEIFYYIAIICHRLEYNNETLKYVNLAREKFNELDNRTAYANSLLNLSIDYSSKGDLDNAIRYSQKSIEQFKYINYLNDLAEIENNLGRLFFEYNDYNESFVHLNRSKEIRRRNSDNKLLETLISICDNYIKLKDLDNSNKTLQDIFNNLDVNNDKKVLDYYILKYRVEYLQGDLQQAEQTLIKALNTASSREYKKEKAEIYIMLGNFYVDSGKSREAADYLSKGVEALKVLGAFEGLQ